MLYSVYTIAFVSLSEGAVRGNELKWPGFRSLAGLAVPSPTAVSWEVSGYGNASSQSLPLNSSALELVISNGAREEQLQSWLSLPLLFGLKVGPLVLKLVFHLFLTDLPCSGLFGCSPPSSLGPWMLWSQIKGLYLLCRGGGLRTSCCLFKHWRACVGPGVGLRSPIKASDALRSPVKSELLLLGKGAGQLSINRIPESLMPLFIKSVNQSTYSGDYLRNMFLFWRQMQNIPINLDIQAGFLWGLLIKQETKGQHRDL
jgi:hypothetical protein